MLNSTRKLLQLWVLLVLFRPTDGDYIVTTAWGERVITAQELPAYEAFNTAVDAARSGNVHDAVTSYEAALALKPDLSEGLINLATLLTSRAADDDVAVARKHLLAAINCADHPTVKAAAYSNLAFLEQRVGGHDFGAAQVAEGIYLKALASDPTFVDAMYNYGTLLEDQSRYDDATAQYREVLNRKPDHSTAQLNLANCLFRKGDLQSAIEAQRRLWGDKSKPLPSRVSALNNAGQVYRDAGEHGEALKTFEMALELVPGDALSIANALQARRTLCAWHGVGKLQTRLLAATILELAGNKTSTPSTIKGAGVSVQPYDALLMPEVGLRLQREIANAHASPWNSASQARRQAALLNPQEAPPRTPSTKLRVLYLGFDFRDHPMGHLTKGLVTGHNTSSVHTSIASYGENDGSPIRRRVEEAADTFLELRNVADHEASDLMARQTPDVVIDLMAHTRGTRTALAASKPALALLVNYLGYPSTVGGAYFDYALVDRVAVPPETASKGAFTEKLVYLPHSYQANEYPLDTPLCSGLITPEDIGSISKSPPGLERFERCLRATAEQLFLPEGLPDKSDENIDADAGSRHENANDSVNKKDGSTVTICNFNNVDKFEPASFSVWMSLLRRHPTSVLVLLAQSGRTRAAEKNLRDEAASMGVHPSRVHFLPRAPKAKHLARLSGCDISVDNFVYGMHTTLSDALSAAVPSVTSRGMGSRGGGEVHGRMQSRVGVSLLKAAGGVDSLLAANSIRDFEDTANRLLSSKLLRLALRRKLARAVVGEPLYNTPLLVRHVESAFQGMVEIRHAGRNSGGSLIAEEQTMHLVVADRSSLYGAEGGNREQWALESLIDCLEQTTTCSSDSALVMSERLLSASPMNADYWHLRGLALYRQGSLSSAIAAIRKALVLEPSAAFFWSNLAVVTRASGHLKEAACALRMQLALNPFDVGALTQLQTVLGTGDPGSLEIFNALVSFWNRLESFPSNARGVSEAAFNHAIGVSKNGGRGEDVVLWLEEALRLDPLHHAAHLKLGAALEAVGRYEDSVKTFFEAVRAEHRNDFAAIEQEGYERVHGRLEHRPQGKPSLAIYCYEYGQTWWPNWGPRSVGSGLGGSEEAVVFLSREMAKFGYHVEVYTSPPAEDVGRKDEHGVLWLDYRSYDTSRPADIFVAWRYHISAALALPNETFDTIQDVGSRGAKVYVWLQDVPSFSTYTESFTRNLAGIFTLSAFHSRQLPLHAQSKTVVTPNGIDPSFFIDGPNVATKFVYGSAPNRGLETVLRAWPSIRDAINQRTANRVAGLPRLDVYYGFTEAFIKYGQKSIPSFNAWRQNMEELLQQEGVHNHGMVDHTTLAKGYADAGFVLYPTVYPETGCVTLMKAMAMGAVPITSRYYDSTLPELTRDFDLAPRALYLDHDTDPGWLREWVDAVVNASIRDLSGDLAEHRALMKNTARTRFLWGNVAQLWHTAFSSSYPDYVSR